MGIEQEAFRAYNEKKLDTFTVRLNRDEREELDRAKKILNQSKDSTALKTLSSIGMNVLHDGLTGQVIKTIFANQRRNYKTGIDEFD